MGAGAVRRGSSDGGPSRAEEVYLVELRRADEHAGRRGAGIVNIVLGFVTLDLGGFVTLPIH